MRANSEPFDKERGCAGFEKNPFNWTSEGRTSHVPTGFLWSWQAHTERHEPVLVYANDLFKPERSIPRPVDLKSPSEDIWTSCVAAARKQHLCNYLGNKNADGSFEPDPKKWPVKDKWTARVWFEWRHVYRTRNGVREPHRVCVEVLYIVIRKKKVPHGPATGHAPLSLEFTLEYMQELAASVHSDCEYVGLAFESDRPAFQMEVPDGGKDIQDHPVYWSTPTGTKSASIREICIWTDDHFRPPEPENNQMYEAIGTQMNWEILGVCQNEADLVHYLSEPGALAEERGKALDWSKPERDTIPCWWLVFSGQIKSATLPPFVHPRTIF